MKKFLKLLAAAALGGALSSGAHAGDGDGIKDKLKSAGVGALIAVVGLIAKLDDKKD